MNTINKTIMAAALCALPLGAMAEVNIDFETPESYKSIGVYDVWEESPFRTGVLEGNVAVTANPLTGVSEITGEASNPSAKVLGAQRSRFGSNRFGVRVDLTELMPVGTTTQYVHVMLLTPKEGRVMLVGLGSREDRPGQNPFTEQFWTLSSTSVKPGEWCDAVFAVRTNDGINLRSLVLVPDCESPHNLTEDFLFYVDNIVVNDSPLSRIANEFYPISGDKATVAMSRTDRYSSAIKFKVGTKTQTISFSQSGNHLLYQDCLSKAFYVKPGQTVTPSINFTGTWMHAYCFIDYNRDGQFTATLNDDGTPAEGSDVVAYNYCNGKNSKGASASNNQGSSCGTMPSFTVPADLAPGMYRIRYKIDWDCIDPMGSATPGNLIADNGGVIADAMLCVYGDKVTLNDFQLNGEILGQDDAKLQALQVPADEEYTIKSAPEKGFHNGGVDVKCGYNLDGEQIDKYGNYQYTIFEIPAKSFAEDGTYTIPAAKMRANLLFNGRMIEDGADNPDDYYTVNFPKDLKISRTDRSLNSFTLATDEDDYQVSLINNTENYVYVSLLEDEVPVMAGETITPSVNYSGSAMHTYWYVDLNEDGKFSTDLNDDGTPAAGGELLSYSYLDGKNSLGATISAPGMAPSVNHPFAIPAGTPEGVYRARFKIDWNYSDPGGQYGQGQNDIQDNAGYVVDFMIHVHGTSAPVTATVDDTTGNLTAGNATIGATTPYAAPRGENLTVSALTDKGLLVSKLTARYGYRLNSSKAVMMGNTYWNELEIAPEGQTYLIPAAVMDRPVKLIATIDGEGGISEIELDPAGSNAYNLKGIQVAKPTTPGLYIINGQKTLVK